MSISTEVLDGFIKNIKKQKSALEIQNACLRKPERDSLIELQRKVYRCVHESGDKDIRLKHKEFVRICDEVIYREKKKEKRKKEVDE